MFFMKICFLNLSAYALFHPEAKEQFGGAEVQQYILSQELKKKSDIEISFVVGDYGHNPHIESVDGVTLYKNGNERFFPFLWLMRRINADIYLVRAAARCVGKWAIFAKLLRKKFIFMVASDIDCDGKFEANSSFFEALAHKIALRLSNAIVAQNYYQKSLLNKRGLNNVIVIKKGLNSASYVPDSPRRQNILWVGRCDFGKNPELFVDLAKYFPSEKFIMVCPMTRNEQSYFDKIRSSVSNVDNLTFHSYLTPSEMTDILLSSKISVLTSDYEGDLPMSSLEALKYGIPVLSLHVNPDDCFNLHNIGLFCNGNFDTLVSNMRKIISDDALYKQLQNNCTKYFNDFHDIVHIAKQYLTLFNSKL